MYVYNFDDVRFCELWPVTIQSFSGNLHCDPYQTSPCVHIAQHSACDLKELEFSFE